MSVSGLSRKHVHKARDLAIQAAVLGARHQPEISYTQGGDRWNWHRYHMKAYKGDFPHNLDCSAFVTWCIWNGLSHYGVRDTVNGERWLYGWTGTMVNHGLKVHTPLWRADVILYGNPFGLTGHTAIYVGGGYVISHGSERGPLKLPMFYRRDVYGYRRYI